MSTNGFKRGSEEEKVSDGRRPARAGTVHHDPPVPQPVGSVQTAPVREGSPQGSAGGGTVFDPARYGAVQPSESLARAISTGALARQGLWFYLIAGLSFLNSLAVIGGVTLGFAGGLGITRQLELAGKIQNHAGPFLATSAAIAGVFVLIGVFAQHRSKGAFLIGLMLYGVDGLLLCFDGFVQNVWPIVVHVFISYKLYRSYDVLHDLESLKQ